MPPSGKRVDPIIANRFYLDLGKDGVSVQEVGGIDFETEMGELQQSSKSGRVAYIKTPGANPLKMGKITVKYAAYKGDPMEPWRNDVIAGKMEKVRKDISLVLYDHEAKEVLRFNFKNAWPSKRAFSSLTSKGNDPLAVTITLDHEGVTVKGYNE